MAGANWRFAGAKLVNSETRSYDGLPFTVYCLPFTVYCLPFTGMEAVFTGATLVNSEEPFIGH